MKSNDEEYLDSLLNSAQQSNNGNPKSALSRMSGKKSSGSEMGNGSGDFGALVDNSNGNEDLREIGSLLDRLDQGVMVDERMADLLDNIESPSESGIPKFTVGDAPSINDVRDPEEIALDEAIADAERLDAEIRSGKFNASPVEEPAPQQEPEPVPTPSPIVDLEEGDDALLEMAPEVSLPEDSGIALDNKQDSDADQTPEEILTDLLDDMPDNNLTAPAEESVQESLSDVLDNIKEEEVSLEDLEAAMDMALGEDEPSKEASVSEESILDIPEESVPEIPIESDPEPLKESVPEIPIESEPEEPAQSEEPSAPESGEDGLNLDDLSVDDMNLDDLAKEAGLDEMIDEAAPEEQAPLEPTGLDYLMSGEALMEEPSETPAEETQESATSGVSLDSLSEDDFNLDALEASLDNLLGGEEGDNTATEGEVAALADIAQENANAASEEGAGDDVSMQDLDALMNSLANDEIEDLESTAKQDEESGHPQEEEIPKEDILGALTEDGFGDLGEGEPTLDELASIPDRSSGGGSGGGGGGSESEGKDGKKKKEKKEGFFARLLKALTREDEETDGEGLASLTDENQQVLNELGEDGGKKSKKKKEKKEKKPKKEKPKKEKKPKEKKPPKPKKEKKPKPPKDPGVPEKAISPKKVALAFLFAASLGILVCIPAFALPDKIASNRAKTAHTHKEYTTAYKMLYGKDMTEEESVIYEQSRVLAWSQRYLDGYENYTAMNMKEEALDMLLMAMRNRDDLLEEAAKYSVENEVQDVYASIELLLSESYGLSAEDVAEINSIKKDRDYTIRLMEIVGTIES